MKRRGRPEEWRIDADGAVRKFFKEVDKRGRIALGLDLVEPVGRELLAIMRDAGCLRLVSWRPHGETVERHSLTLRERTMHEDAVRTLQRIHTRYERVTVDAVGRFALPPGARLHLAVLRGQVIVWSLPNAIEVWSPAYASSQADSDDDELDGLP